MIIVQPDLKAFREATKDVYKKFAEKWRARPLRKDPGGAVGQQGRQGAEGQGAPTPQWSVAFPAPVCSSLRSENTEHDHTA